MTDMAEIAARLRRTAAMPPGREALERAARRAVDRTNAAFMASQTPLRARVVQKGRNVRVEVTQTGRLDRPFGRRTPLQLLNDNVTAELASAQQEITNEARKALS